MCTTLVRAALMCASLTLGILPGVPVNAELPNHHKVVTLRSDAVEVQQRAGVWISIFSGVGSSPFSMAPRLSGSSWRRQCSISWARRPIALLSVQ
jgi:hypothetical protein